MHFVFDVGGTHTRCAISKNGESLDEKRKCKTPSSYEEGIGLLIKNAKEMAKGASFLAIGGGIAGVLDVHKKIPVRLRNLTGWEGRNIAQDMQDALGASCMLENDAALAGLAESVFGAGKDFSIVAYLTVSTGVGGARIVDKKIDRNALGFSPGNQIIHEGGTLEEWVSGSGFQKRFGKPAEEVEQPAWEEAAALFSYGLMNTIVHWSPDAVVLGGPLILKNTHMFFEHITERTADIMRIFPRLPVFKKAALEDRAGLLGALYMLRTSNSSL